MFPTASLSRTERRRSRQSPSNLVCHGKDFHLCRISRLTTFAVSQRSNRDNSQLFTFCIYSESSSFQRNELNRKEMFLLPEKTYLRAWTHLCTTTWFNLLMDVAIVRWIQDDHLRIRKTVDYMQSVIFGYALTSMRCFSVICLMNSSTLLW